jgi:hypothetical protein
MAADVAGALETRGKDSPVHEAAFHENRFPAWLPDWYVQWIPYDRDALVSRGTR